MKKSFKIAVPILILILILLLAFILILPKISKQEYAVDEEDISQKEEEEEKEKPQKIQEKYTLDNLNMRTGPSTNHERILTIPTATKVMVIGQENGWDEIKYKNEVGFVSGKYLTKFKEEARKVLENKREQETSTAQDSPKPEKVGETMKIVNNILIVNKTYGLPSTYNPGENPTARAHLNQMIKGAQEEIGEKIMSVSGFRSYNYQKGLYNRYVKKDGEKKASVYSAKPGHSEHQTGLAFDIGGVEKKHWVTDSFVNTEEAKWLKHNAHRYGFILRYPKGKEGITGYKFEPWHFRYVGAEHAVKIYENNLTLEEYLFN